MTNSHVVFLKGKTPDGMEVTLRPPEKEDIPLLQKWINDPENRQNLAVVFPLSKKQEEQWIERVANCDDLPSDIVLMVCVDNNPVGVVGLHGINYVHGFAETGINIGEKKYRGKGIGSTAKKLMVDYAFGELNLHSLNTSVYSFNKASRNLQKSCGWQEVGRYRKKFLKNGRWTDVIIYQILRKKWKKQKQR